MNSKEKEEKEEKIELSIVIPVLNEEENLRDLHFQLSEVLRKVGVKHEIIIVDDGSRDNSLLIFEELTKVDPNLTVIRFRRNFGQTAAISAGFAHASGEVVITMDGDLQNDPQDIPRLLEKIDEGYDVVSGWRADRKDKFITRRIPSILANKLTCKITGVNLHDFGCTLKAYRKEIVKNIKLYGEMHRFIPALASWVGANIVEIKVAHHPRRKGRSKYGISRTLRVLLDLITVKFLLKFSTRPIQVFGKIGLLSGFIGFLICAYLSIAKLFFPSERTSLNERMPMLLLGVLLVFVGIQFITMGLLGEMMARTYHESQDKPIYVIRDIVGNRKNDKNESGKIKK